MPAMTDAPGYWMDETTGLLGFAVHDYLRGLYLDQGQIALLRAYFRQWIEKGKWQGEHVPMLRRMVNNISSRTDIDAWLALAGMEGIDPL